MTAISAETLSVVVLVAVPLLIEAARSAYNEAAQRARGGIEPADDVYPIMRIAYPAAFIAMIVEGALGGGAARGWFAGGIVVFLIAKAVKWWAILSLGRHWTFRVIVVPGDTLVATGPYRFLRHPNYVGVVLELAGVALMTGARIAGPIATIAFVFILAKRIAVEERMLYSANVESRRHASTLGSRG